MNSRSYRNASVYFSVILMLLFLSISPCSLCAKEGTVYLSLKKTAVSKDKVHSYVVKKGDNVTNIIRRQLGAKDKDIDGILEAVKALNTKIRNINRIYPGQKLFLPGKSVKMKGRGLIPTANRLSIVKHVMNQLDESITTSGSYYIPIPPAGQVTINCSMMPVIELEGGGKVILDFSSQIPKDIRKIIKSTWENYSFVDSSDEIFPALEKIINKSDKYSFRKFGKYVKVGETPRIDIMLDWLISNKAAPDEKPSLYGFRLVRDRSELLPYPVKKYSEENGLTITEIMAGSGVASAPDENFPDPDFPAINSGTNRELVNSLLAALGYTPAQNAEVKIFDATEDGFDMSVKADLLLESKGEHIVISFKKLSQQFVDIFKKRGARIIFVSEREEKKTVVQKVFYALNIPFYSDEFKFSIPERGNNPSVTIYLPAIKTTKDKSTSYLTNLDIDHKIHGLLHKKRGVNLIKY